MFKARNRSFRSRTTGAEEQVDEPPVANVASAAQVQAASAPALSVSKMPAKVVLSFGEEEEGDAEVITTKMRPFQRSSAARDTEMRDKEPATSIIATAAYRPATGEYTAERLAELRRNSFFFNSDAPKGAPPPKADDQSQQPITHASHDRHVHFGGEPVVEAFAGEDAERLEKQARETASSDVLSQLAALRGGPGTDAGADKVINEKRSDVARMQRSRVRQGEANSGFMSLDSSKAEGDESGTSARLLAEDEHDVEEEAFDDYVGKSIAFGPAAMARAAKAKRREAVEDVAQEAEDEEQLQWETEQMRKAAGRQMTGAQAALIATAANRDKSEPLPSSFPTLAHDSDSKVAEALAELKLRHATHARERAQAVEAQRTSTRNAAETEKPLKAAQSQREFFQSFRVFLGALLACLAQKAPQLDALADSVTAASTAVGVARTSVPLEWTGTAENFDFADPEELNDATVAQRSPALLDALGKLGEAEQQVRSLFGDASAEFSDAAPLLERMAHWRVEYSALFGDAYAALSLPNLVSPYLRRDLLLWQPLDDVPTPVESLPSFRASLEFSVAANAPVGSDEALLLPRLVESYVAPRTAHLFTLYRPMSGRHTERALSLLAQLADEPLPVLRPLANAVLATLTASVATLLASEASAASAHASLRFWRVCKLYRHVCAWHPYLAAATLQSLALGQLLPRLTPLLTSLPPSVFVALIDVTPPAWLAASPPLPQLVGLRNTLTSILRRPDLSSSALSLYTALIARLPR